MADKAEAKSGKLIKKYRLYKFVTLGVLVLFLLGGLVLFQKDITLENLRYLVKYVGFYSGTPEGGSTILYDADTENVYGSFRGDLAVVNHGGMSLYDRMGTAVLTDSFNMTNPVMESGDKFLIVYDLGGHNLRVYNSFSLLHEENFEYTIQSVSVNAAGYYSVATAQRSYHAAVVVYNDDFKEVFRWLSAEKFVTDCVLTDTEAMYLTTIRVEGGDLVGEVLELKVGRDEVVSSYELTDEMPIDIAWTRKGVLYLTDTSLRFVSGGEALKSNVFPTRSLDKAVMGDSLCVVAQNELSVGVSMKLRLFDREGNETASRDFSAQIQDLEVYDEEAILLTYNHLYRLTSDGNWTDYQISGDYSAIAILGQNTVALCSDSRAEIMALS
ncbi:MAG: hypothetical protein J6Z79_06470 [Clostridia bacterium]|nr:hypothetical protein [Clostridia bacterium]